MTNLRGVLSGTKWSHKILFSLAIALVATMALGAATDIGKTSKLIQDFGWQYLPAALGLTLVNYCLRFLKWQYYLGIVEVTGLSLPRSAFVFFSSFAMVLTPGKLGEWLKSYLLREMAGTPVGVSAPIVIAERLTDGLAMALLASTGLLMYAYAWQMLALALLPVAVVILLINQPRLAATLFGIAERFPYLSSRMHHAREFYTSSRRLLRPRRLLVAVGLGVVSWGSEALAFYLILLGLGLPASLTLVLQATFVLALSTLVGALALTPGGIAVAEGSIAGLLLVLGTTTEPSIAGAATLLIRFCTLWFGVGIGVVTLVGVSRLMRRGNEPAAA